MHALAEAPQSHQHEIEHEPQIVFHEQDFEVRRSQNMQNWQEVSIQVAAEGSMEVEVHRFSFQTHVEPSEEADSLSRATPAALYRTANDCSNIYQRAQGNFAPVISGLGIATTREEADGAERYRVHIPGEGTVRGNLDYLRFHTGFAPGIESVEGVKFSNERLGQAIKDKMILVATDPRERVHDMLTHVSAWSVLPESMFELMAKRIESIESHPTMSKELLDMYMLTVDHFMNTAAFFDLVEKMQSDPSNKNAAQAFLGSITAVTGIDDEEVVGREARLILRRVHEVSTAFATRN